MSDNITITNASRHNLVEIQHINKVSLHHIFTINDFVYFYENGIINICICNGKTVGYIVVCDYEKLNKTMFTNKLEQYKLICGNTLNIIVSFSVLTRHKNKGIGKMLLSSILEYENNYAITLKTSNNICQYLLNKYNFSNYDYFTQNKLNDSVIMVLFCEDYKMDVVDS
jgi:GNAT superfamily N-acetyltransferase